MKKIIAIDVGNSETTVGVGNSSQWTGYRFTTRKTITSDELLMMFKTIIDVKPIKENTTIDIGKDIRLNNFKRYFLGSTFKSKPINRSHIELNSRGYKNCLFVASQITLT